MPEILLIKDANGRLVPATSEACDQVEMLKVGEMYMAKITLKRNGRFFRKWIKLIDYAFGLFNELHAGVVVDGRLIRANKRRFRHDVTIMAGFCEPVISATGEISYLPEDVSFGSMSEERFAHLYDATLNVLIEKVFHDSHLSKKDMDDAVNYLLTFS